MSTPFSIAMQELAETELLRLPAWAWLQHTNGCAYVISSYDLAMRFGGMTRCQCDAIRQEIHERLVDQMAPRIAPPSTGGLW